MSGLTWNEEQAIVEEFMIFQTDFVERLKAHYRQGEIVKGEWVNVKEVILDKEDILTEQYYSALLEHNKQKREEDEEEEIEEFNSDKLDNILYPDGLDWTFEKPTKGKYHTIYIIKKEEEEEEELVECDFCGKEEDPDEIIRGTEGEACGECRHLCDRV